MFMSVLDVFFFFKQKTAYDMRISDWSSDVCSSDLMETVDPTNKNQNQFMRVDKSGDFFSIFFSNFFSQLKNPTNFSFFKVPAPIAVEKAQEMQNQVDKPTAEGDRKSGV